VFGINNLKFFGEKIAEPYRDSIRRTTLDNIPIHYARRAQYFYNRTNVTNARRTLVNSPTIVVARVLYQLADTNRIELFESGGHGNYSISTAIAIPSPPPIHSAATPFLPPVFFKPPSKVTRMRAPDAPIG
jgi:hypothetical protein